MTSDGDSCDALGSPTRKADNESENRRGRATGLTGVRFPPLNLTPECFALPGDRLGALPGEDAGCVNHVVHVLLLSVPPCLSKAGIR
jgi:hypothetical protein